MHASKNSMTYGKIIDGTKSRIFAKFFMVLLKKFGQAVPLKVVLAYYITRRQLNQTILLKLIEAKSKTAKAEE